MIEAVIGVYLLIGLVVFVGAHFDETCKREILYFYSKSGNIGLFIYVLLGLSFTMVFWGPAVTYLMISGELK